MHGQPHIRSPYTCYTLVEGQIGKACKTATKQYCFGDQRALDVNHFSMLRKVKYVLVGNALGAVKCLEE